MNRLNRIYLDPSGGEGGDPTPAPKPEPTPAPKPANADERFAKLLTKYDGDATKLAAKLHSENFHLREKIRGFESTAPKEGARVLSPEDAAEFDAYRAFGKPVDIKTAIDERDRLHEESDKARRADLATKAANATGYKAPLLLRLAQQDRIEFEVRDETVNGLPGQVAYVKTTDGKGKPVAVKLADHAKAAWPDLLDSLTADPPRPPLGTPPRANGAGPPPSHKPEVGPPIAALASF